MESKKYFYYRIYDDKEEKNYFKSCLDHAKIVALLKEYEKTNEEYFNSDFVTFVKAHDPEVELIEMHNIFY
jgi:hypothetical protein